LRESCFGSVSGAYPLRVASARYCGQSAADMVADAGANAKIVAGVLIHAIARRISTF